MKTISRTDADALGSILNRVGYSTGGDPHFGPAWCSALADLGEQAEHGQLAQIADYSTPATPAPAVVTTAPVGLVRFVDLYHLNDFQGAHEPVALAAKLKAAGVPALIHKASDGLSTAHDPLCLSRLAAARAAGLLIGAYHFTQPGDGAAQADNFLAAIGDYAHDPRFLMALDFEPGKGGEKMSLADGRAFIARIIEKTGRAPMVYGGGGMLRDDLAGVLDATFARCPLWLAEYNPTAHIIAPTWKAYTFWQYREDSAGIDWNVWRGTEADFRAAWPFSQAAA